MVLINFHNKSNANVYVDRVFFYLGLMQLEIAFLLESLLLWLIFKS